MIDGHGDDLFRYAQKIKHNFSTNIPQNIDHSGLLEHLSKKGAIFINYPEPEPRSVEEKLSTTLGIDTENIIVTSGATEAIYLLAHAFRGAHSAIIAPTFREYQDACKVFDHTLLFLSSIDLVEFGYDMVWLCNPNNPTGKVFDRANLLAVIDNHPSTIFVIDQAYGEYSVRDVLNLSDILERKNALMLQSLTKQFMVPGLRIGYAIGPDKILSRLRTLRMPWSVNSIAIESALYLLENESAYKINRHILNHEARRIALEMRKMGIEAGDTDCNFILARLHNDSASNLKSWLIDNHGLLIRDASNFETLSPAHFRVAAQSSVQNDLLINALKEWTLSYQ